jgi:hypothetical protein
LYSDVLWEKKWSSLANYMDKARGGYYEKIPTNYPNNAWYTYNDETCDYWCQVTEYLYWSFTSYLWAQNNRINTIWEEWKLNNKSKLINKDNVYKIFENKKYKLPTILPDGKYKIKTD